MEASQETSDAIQHDDEPKGNAVRHALAKVSGVGQRTYTPTQAVVTKAHGNRLWTADNRELIDFASGVLVANLGHNHARFEELFRQYAADYPRNAYNLVTPIEVTAAERLIESMNTPNAEKVLWAASGSEGIQKAMWAALAYHPDRSMMVATRGGFHGKKGLAGDVTGEESDNPDVVWVSFPAEEEHKPEFYKSELDNLAAEYGDEIALLVTEPYLGAAGSYHPPKWYHQTLLEWCNEHDVIFIFDEVQSCHGRTGNMYAFQSYEVEPDLVVLGKGLGNGEPVAAVVGRADVIDALDFGEGSDTFSGNPRACAAVCATLDVFEEEGILQRVAETAPMLRALLDRLHAAFPFITAVRGEGMVYGIEIVDTETANRCVLEAYRGDGHEGVHFLGPLAGNVLRVSPPLIIEESELNRAEAVLMESWGRV